MQLSLWWLLSCCCLAAASGQQEEEILKQWLDFKQNYGKRYRNVRENNKSYRNFKRNLQIIAQHNLRFEQGKETYKMALNPFTDMALEEMQQAYMGLKISESNKQEFLKLTQFVPVPIKNLQLPTAVDWRQQGAIGPVKNQQACGSCWAFASTAALEAHHFLEYNKSVILSEQNLVDCVRENWGCEGGWMIPSFEYVRLNEGINAESQYPYEAEDGQCRFKSDYIAATCKGYQRIREHDEQHLMQAVASEGPIAVAIAVNSNFLQYNQGIYDDAHCSQAVNHAVLLVGYGTEDDKDYWLVRNSWGLQWGEVGYIKMARNKQNQCGIASFASYPLV